MDIKPENVGAEYCLRVLVQTPESSELVEVMDTISLMYIFSVEEMQKRPACIHTIFLIGVLCNVRTGKLEHTYLFCGCKNEFENAVTCLVRDRSLK